MLTLVIYDITNDKQRTKLSNHLKRYGLKRVQYSGFLGELNSHDRIVLQEEVKRYVRGEKDSIYIVPLCERCARTCKIISTHEITLHEDKITIV
ncbi:MAG: CRISPR-associated endonuclease Cas2 [Candidatus Helarchaeota archaeon]